VADDAEGGATAAFKGGFSKKIGPFPAWQWGAIAGGVALLYLYLRRRPGATTATPGQPQPVGAPTDYSYQSFAILGRIAELLNTLISDQQNAGSAGGGNSTSPGIDPPPGADPNNTNATLADGIAKYEQVAYVGGDLQKNLDGIVSRLLGGTATASDKQQASLYGSLLTGDLATRSPVGYHPSGSYTVVRESDSSAVYLLDEGVLHWISSPDAWANLGFRWDQIITAPTGYLRNFKMGYRIGV